MYIPRGADLRSVMDVYKLMGFNGAFGSVDCTHINWRRCPVSLTNFCIGKENTPTLSFLCVVDHSKRKMVCSDAYCGAANDKQIVKVVPEMHALFSGLLEDVQYKLYKAEGNEIVVQGAYLIADGGFLRFGCVVDPSHLLHSMEQTRWSKFLSLFEKMLSVLLAFLKFVFGFFFIPRSCILLKTFLMFSNVVPFYTT